MLRGPLAPATPSARLHPEDGIPAVLAVFLGALTTRRIAAHSGKSTHVLRRHDGADTRDRDQRACLQGDADAAGEIYAAIRDAQPIDEAAAFRIPARVRRRYERLRAFPSGLLSVRLRRLCVQPGLRPGVTSAALQAAALRDHLRRHDEPARRVLPADSKAHRRAVGISTSGGQRFPGAEGKRTAEARAPGPGRVLIISAVLPRRPARHGWAAGLGVRSEPEITVPGQAVISDESRMLRGAAIGLGQLRF